MKNLISYIVLFLTFITFSMSADELKNQLERDLQGVMTKGC